MFYVYVLLRAGASPSRPADGMPSSSGRSVGTTRLASQSSSGGWGVVGRLAPSMNNLVSARARSYIRRRWRTRPRGGAAATRARCAWRASRRFVEMTCRIMIWHLNN